MGHAYGAAVSPHLNMLCILGCKFECITNVGECSVNLYLKYFSRDMTIVQHLYIMDDPSLGADWLLILVALLGHHIKKNLWPAVTSVACASLADHVVMSQKYCKGNTGGSLILFQ